MPSPTNHDAACPGTRQQPNGGDRSPHPLDATPASSDPRPPTLPRRALLGAGLASVVGLALSRLESRRALAADGDSDNPRGSYIQLPDEDAQAFLQNMLQRSKLFKRLYDSFAGKPYEFKFERAKAFLYLSLTDTGYTPNILGVLPSYVPAKPSDPWHRAVSIIVHHAGFALASGVKVEHNPFRISEFVHYEVADINKPTKAKLRTRTIAIEQLRDLARTAALLGKPKLPSDVRQRISGIGTLSEDDQQAVAWAIYDQLISDQWARPVYTDEGWQAMREYRWAVQNFALANLQRYQAVLGSATRQMGAQLKISGACTSCSTSSNACSSTSTCIIIKSDKK